MESGCHHWCNAAGTPPSLPVNHGSLPKCPTELRHL